MRPLASRSLLSLRASASHGGANLASTLRRRTSLFIGSSPARDRTRRGLPDGSFHSSSLVDSSLISLISPLIRRRTVRSAWTYCAAADIPNSLRCPPFFFLISLHKPN